MSNPIMNLMAGYQPCPVVFETPKRSPFATRRFRGFIGAVKLVWQARKEKKRVRSEAYYNEAIRAHSIGRFTQAEKNYDMCLKLKPDHEPAYNNLAALYVERNNPDLAVEALRNSLRHRPNHFRAYYNLALVLHLIGHWKEAVEMLEKAVALHPDHFWSYIALAEIYARREEYETAIEHYRTSLKHTTQPQPVYVRLAELLVHLRRYEEGEEQLRRALELKPQPEIYYNLGWVLAAQEKDPEEIVTMFDEANKGRPKFEQALFNLALAQSLKGKNELSVENMTAYVQQYVKSKDPEVKYQEYLREVNPHNYPAMLRVAILYSEANHAEKAVEVLKKLLKYKPNFTAGVEKLAEVYRNMGRYKDAIQTYRELIKYEPDNIRGFIGLTKAYGAVENYAAALPVIRKVLELDPNNTELHYQYATLMAQENKLSLAFKHYRIVANLDPGFPRIQKRLKMLEEEMEEQSEISPPVWPTVERPE